MYPWPIGNFDYVMDDALSIAMDFLISSGKTVMFMQAQDKAAKAITEAWRAGVRNKIRLANIAVSAVERDEKLRQAG